MASIFSKILSGEIPGQILYQDELCAAVRDIHPQAPAHVLVFPIQELPSLALAGPDHAKTLGHMLLVAAQLARDLGLSQNGYRVVINTGAHGGQSVDHLHMHILGGRPLNWPPG